jgi:hypothetical protein
MDGQQIFWALYIIMKPSSSSSGDGDKSKKESDVDVTTRASNLLVYGSGKGKLKGRRQARAGETIITLTDDDARSSLGNQQQGSYSKDAISAIILRCSGNSDYFRQQVRIYQEERFDTTPNSIVNECLRP